MPAAATQHPRNHLSAQFSRSEVVDFRGHAKDVVGCVGEATGNTDARVVHQDVDRSRFLLDPTAITQGD